MNDRMHFQLNPSTIRSLNNSIFERQTLRRQPEVEIHFNKFGWGLYAGSGGGGVWSYVLFLYVFCLQIDGPINGGVGGAYKKQFKGTVPRYVTTHLPAFDFLTGCREFKRCEGCKRTLRRSVCIAVGRVRCYTKTSQNFRSMIILFLFPLCVHYRDTVPFITA